MTESKLSSTAGAPLRQRQIRLAVMAAAGLILLVALWFMLPDTDAPLERALLSATQSEGARAVPSFGATVSTPGSVSFSASSSALPQTLLDEISTAPDVAQSELAALRPASPTPVLAASAPQQEPTPAISGISSVSASTSAAEERGHSSPAPAPAPLKPPVSAEPIFLQVGVFNNPRNAQALMKQLKAAGVPAQVQTRVQIGPFRNQEELVRAQEKLHRLGIDSGGASPASARRP